MNLRIRLATVFVLLAGLLGVGAANANILFPAPLESNPTDAQMNVLREQGRKGLLFKFHYFLNDGVTEVPLGTLNLAGAAGNITLTIGANAAMICTPGSTPAAGACSYRNVEGPTLDGQLDYVEVLYNGDFPAFTNVVLSVGGVASGLGGEVQNPNPSTVNFQTAGAAPRVPVNIELVFDHSGSMALPAVPAGSVTRMTALRTASQAFLNVLIDHAFVGDKVGLVSFDHTAGVVLGFQAAHDVTPVNAVQAQINLLAPAGATSIGEGLRIANVNGFATEPALRKRVVLFSDGEQNTESCVRFDNPGPTLNLVTGAGCPAGAGGAPTAYPADISVCPVTAGLMTAPGFALQQDIAVNRCSGRNAHISNGNENFALSDLQTFFTQLATDILIGDKLELVRDTNGNLAPGATVVEPFIANPEDIALSIFLSWPGGTASERRLRFQLEAPDGTLVPVDRNTRFGNGMSFTTLPLPVQVGGNKVATAGEWKIRLDGANVPSTLPYHLIVLLDNTLLASDFSTPVSDPGTGEAIPVQVRLAEKGAPVLGATVTVTVRGPKEGLGDVLSEPSRREPVQSPDTGLNAAANGKLNAILNDPAIAARLADQSLPTLTLADDGDPASGDATAGDGIYSGLFRDTQEEGHYQLTFDVKGNAPANGDYRRTYRLSVFARPKPDKSSTDFQVVSQTTADRGVHVVLRALPRDRNKNLLGPGYLGSLSINVDGGTVVRPLQDNLDGSYQITYLIPTALNPKASLVVFGQTVVEEPISQLKGGSLFPFAGLGAGAGSGGWRLSLHFGKTDPYGSFSNVADGAASFGLDLEHIVNAHFSAELYAGRDQFDSKVGGDDPRFDLLSLRGRWYPLQGGVLSPSLFVGAGGYRDQDSDTAFGLEAGAALDWWISSSLAIELGYTYRSVDSGDFKYGAYQAGLRIGL